MNITRRSLLTVATAVMLPSDGTRYAFAQASQFDIELEALLKDEKLLELTREKGNEKDDLIVSRGTVKTRKKNFSRKLSNDARKLIVAFEVSSAEVYKRKYQGVIKPGGASGPTIGIGYDIGYVTPENLREDWTGYISEAYIERLATKCGLTGTKAAAALADLKDIVIPYETAFEQFTKNVEPIYMAATINALKNTEKLSDDSLGALVSLVYNRGPSFRKSGERYKQMRSIATHMATEKFHLIPQDFENMKVLWQTPDVIGVARRRHLEALLFQKGLVR